MKRLPKSRAAMQEKIRFLNNGVTINRFKNCGAVIDGVLLPCCRLVFINIIYIITSYYVSIYISYLI